MRRAPLVMLAVLAAVGCSERDAQTRARRAGLLLEAAATPAHPLDVAFDDKVELLGYDLDAEQLVPDKSFVITWYWRVRAPLGQGVQLFTHLHVREDVLAIGYSERRCASSIRKPSGARAI
jgi:hypothetical protein